MPNMETSNSLSQIHSYPLTQSKVAQSQNPSMVIEVLGNLVSMLSLAKHPTGLSFKGRHWGYSNPCTGLLSLVQLAVTVCILATYVQSCTDRESYELSTQSYLGTDATSMGAQSLLAQGVWSFRASKIETIKKKCFCNATMSIFQRDANGAAVQIAKVSNITMVLSNDTNNVTQCVLNRTSINTVSQNLTTYFSTASSQQYSIQFNFTNATTQELELNLNLSQIYQQGGPLH